VAFYLGIDGGGSKTTCTIGDDTSILGTGTSGASNFIRVGGEKARHALAAAVQDACADAKISPDQIERTCIGLAGAARAEVRDWVQRAASELVSGEIEIVGDNITALHAAFGAGPGVVVIAGTGSIAFGRNSRGDTARAGGWGFAVSDEGSGHWIGRAAVSAALRAEDAADSVALMGNILQAWNLSSRDVLVMAANATPSPDFATLVPVVIQSSESGDRAANDVLTRAGTELAGIAAIVLRRILTDEPAQVAMSGGVFRHSSLVRETFYNRLEILSPGISIRPEIVDPVQGALELARAGIRNRQP
jgi:glucosamine kinase